MRTRAFRFTALLLAALVPAAMPCLAAMPGAKTACPMAGCGDTGGASFDTLRPCCCAGSASAMPVASLQTAPLPTAPQPSLLAPGGPPVEVVALGSRVGPEVEPVPLYLKNAALLI